MDAQVELDEIAEVARVESGTGEDLLDPGGAEQEKPDEQDKPKDERDDSR